MNNCTSVQHAKQVYLHNYNTVIVWDINSVLIIYAINKDVLAQYSCTLNVLVVLIECYLYIIPPR